jgi:lipid-A-disaccharide synthase
MVLLPFEPPYFTRVGLPCTYVGHPVVESGADRGDGAGFRRRHGIAADAPLLVVLPGSRRGEVGRLLPPFAGAVSRLAVHRPGLRIVVPTTETVAEIVTAATRSWAAPVLVVRGEREKYDAFAAGDAAMAASGTVALELAMAGLPAVVAYRLNPLTHWLLRRIVRVDYVHLVNLILEREAVPELIQQHCNPTRLAVEVDRLLEDAAAREAQQLACRQALLRLGLGDLSPSRRAAEVVLSLMAAPGARASLTAA